MRMLLRHDTTSRLCPDHKRIHRSFNVLLLAIAGLSKSKKDKIHINCYKSSEAMQCQRSNARNYNVYKYLYSHIIKINFQIEMVKIVIASGEYFAMFFFFIFLKHSNFIYIIYNVCSITVRAFVAGNKVLFKLNLSEEKAINHNETHHRTKTLSQIATNSH